MKVRKTAKTKIKVTDLTSNETEKEDLFSARVMIVQMVSPSHIEDTEPQLSKYSLLKDPETDDLHLELHVGWMYQLNFYREMDDDPTVLFKTVRVFIAENGCTYVTDDNVICIDNETDQKCEDKYVNSRQVSQRLTVTP